MTITPWDLFRYIAWGGLALTLVTAGIGGVIWTIVQLETIMTARKIQLDELKYQLRVEQKKLDRN